LSGKNEDDSTRDGVDFRDYLVYTPQEEYIEYPRRVYGGKNERKTYKKIDLLRN
jgi:hypothetical protein